MPTLVRLLAVILLPAALAGACAEPASDPNGETGGAEEAHASGAEAIGFGESLAQIRGHHLVSLELYEAGDEQGAAVHASHPVDEILASVQSELGEHDPDTGEALAASLEEGLGAVTGGRPADEVAAAYEETATLTHDALVAVVGDEVEEPSFRGSVIAALLSTAAHEYDEAVGADGVRLLAEYQDGYAFVSEARRLYEEIAADVEAASMEEAEEIEEAFETLAEALPSPTPPKQLADKLDVEAAATLIGHELEETVDAEPVVESDPAEVVANIEDLLTEIEETYAAGDAEAAAELSAEAYLENYEIIEADVIELAPEVNEELEPLLGAALRDEIQAGASQEDIGSMIARARELLREALEVLEGAH
ncbi:MAG: hypothetical protein ABR575_07370 [Actinomycetota bacterium]